MVKELDTVAAGVKEQEMVPGKVFTLEPSILE